MPLRTVRILCFGDSLTEGYTQYGNMFHPYAHTMMKTLRLAFPEVKLDISVKGMSGDEVMPPCGNFKPRLEELWKDVVDRGEPFDWVLILGGTNDLATSSTKPEELFRHLEELYEMCFSHGAKVIAMTIPERGAVYKWLDDNRDAVNKLIRNFSKENYYVFDLREEMPFFKLSYRERGAYWDDGLHFTTLGYSKMGNKVAEFFHPLLKAHIEAMPRDPPSPMPPGQKARLDEQQQGEVESASDATTAANSMAAPAPAPVPASPTVAG